MIKLRKFAGFFKFFTGYVTFRAEDGFPQKFIENCRQKGISLFNIKQDGCVIYADVLRRDYRALHRVRKGTDMRLRIVSRYGLPFFLHTHRDRRGLLLGATLFFLLTAILSNRIWCIDVVGNERVSEHDIIDAYRAAGVRVGGRVSALGDVAEEKVLDSMHEIIWTSADNTGPTVTIKVKEGTAVPEIKNLEVPGNIVAKHDGRIVKYEVYEGAEESSLHSAVTKGDLLISGVLTSRDGSVILKPAAGSVIAETTRKTNFTLDRLYRLEEIKSAKPVSSFHFFGIKLGSIMQKKELYQEYNVVFGGKVLPIGRVTGYRKRYRAANLNENQKVLIALDCTFKEQSEILKGCIMRSWEWEICSDKKEASVNCTLNLIEEIGEFRELVIF